MKRIAAWSIAGLLVAGTAAAIAVSVEYRGAVLIPGDQPVTDEQVRAKLQTDGWSDVRIQHDSRYFDVTAVKDNQPRKLTVDSQTGRLASKDDDDDD